MYMIDVSKLVELGDRAVANQIDRGLPIDEATYYGKNETLIACEKKLDQLIQMFNHGNAVSNAVFTMSGEYVEILDEIGDMLGSLFGFRNVQINSNLIAFLPQANVNLAVNPACNLVGSAIIKYTKRMVNGKATMMVDMDRHHRGIKFKPNSVYDLRLFLGTDLFNRGKGYQFTGAEILAIILHEIGHSFYVGPIHEITSDVLNMLNVVDINKLAATMIANSLVVEGASVTTNMVGDAVPTAKKMFSQYYNMMSTLLSPLARIMEVVGPIYSIIALITKFAISTIMTPIKFVGGLVQYDSEKFSDSFATAYGYGAELSSALIKFERVRVPLSPNKNHKATKVTEFLLGITKMPIYYLSLLSDPHSASVTRLENNLKYLKATGLELTNSPKLKKEYEDSLRKLEELERAILNGQNGTTVVDKTHTITLFAEKFTRITSIKDLVSFLQPSRSTYRNLDRPE